MSDLVVAGRFRPPVSRAAVAADWQARGYDCQNWVDPPGQLWKGFVHPTNELVTVVEGRLEIVVDGARLEAGPGDEVFIPSGARHDVRNIGGTTARWLFGYD